MRAAARRLSSWPLQLVGPPVRAEVLDHAAEQAITVTRIPGGQIRFYTPSPLLLARAASVLSKEVDTIAWIDGLDEEAVLWDVGANVGVYSLYAALRRNVTVLAFEPSAANFHVLSKNIQLNDLSGRMTAYCVAFSAGTQLGVLNLSSPRMGAALAQFGRPAELSRYADAQSEAVTQGMIGFSIDDFIEEFNPPFPNALKMDVDGLEREILEGAYKTLRDPRLQSLMVELGVSREDEYRRAFGLLKRAGFGFVSRGEVQGTRTESAANHLFHRVPPVTMSVGCSAESVDLRR